MDEKNLKEERGVAALPSIREAGYGSIILDRLAKHACRIAGVDRACIYVRDRKDPRATIAAAGHGVPLDLIGCRLAADEGMVGTAMVSRKPFLVDDYQDLPYTGEPEIGVTASAALAAPIVWQDNAVGVLLVAATDPARRFRHREVELVCELADIAAAALGHAGTGERVEPTIHAHVNALAAALDLRDRRTARHSEDVVALARRVGELLDLEPAALLELEYAARLHDVGKLRVPDAVLHKDGPLNEKEVTLIKQHPVWGAETLISIAGLEVVATIVRFHHERWDGRGYPDGLSRERIPLASRIISACDAWGAMTADRPYRDRLSLEEALAEIRGGSGAQFDPTVVDALIVAVTRGSRRLRR
jgi:HD-GYP domain-containing protein (c-di-GMP phosphodiesterase class II)